VKGRTVDPFFDRISQTMELIEIRLQELGRTLTLLFVLCCIILCYTFTKLSVFNIYRPPLSSTFSKSFSVFLDEFTSFLSLAATTPHEFITTGDFNIHLDNNADPLTSQFLSLLSSFNLTQHILLSRLSFWFGIHGTVLNWFKSCFSSRSFRVRCCGSLSSPHDSLYGVAQGSVLGPLLFILYATPLSTLISSHSLDHHLYAHDTQIFLSFHPPDFQSSLTHLQNVLKHISS